MKIQVEVTIPITLDEKSVQRIIANRDGTLTVIAKSEFGLVVDLDARQSAEFGEAIRRESQLAAKMECASSPANACMAEMN